MEPPWLRAVVRVNRVPPTEHSRDDLVFAAGGANEWEGVGGAEDRAPQRRTIPRVIIVTEPPAPSRVRPQAPIVGGAGLVAHDGLRFGKPITRPTGRLLPAHRARHPDPPNASSLPTDPVIPNHRTRPPGPPTPPSRPTGRVLPAHRPRHPDPPDASSRRTARVLPTHRTRPPRPPTPSSRPTGRALPAHRPRPPDPPDAPSQHTDPIIPNHRAHAPATPTAFPPHSGRAPAGTGLAVRACPDGVAARLGVRAVCRATATCCDLRS